MMRTLTQDELRGLIHYDPETGDFAWRESKRGRRKEISKRRYGSMGVNGKNYLLHRMAWIYVHGSIPDDLHVDHINLDPSDNRMSNLRLATCAQNHANRRALSTSTTGFKGVYVHRSGKRIRRFVARIRIPGGKQIFLGHFMTAEDAHQSYAVAAKKYHGKFARAS